MQGCRALAPIVASAGPVDWDSESKGQLRKLLRAKGGKGELDFARRLCADNRLLKSLQSACRDMQRRRR